MTNEVQNAVNYLTGNKVVMTFLENEAREQVAADVRAKTGSGTTAKAVELMLASGNDASLTERFEDYMRTGLAVVVALRLQS